MFLQIQIALFFKVLGDNLPPKHEHIVECDLVDRQRRIYDKVFASGFKMIHSDETNKSKGIVYRDYSVSWFYRLNISRSFRYFKIIVFKIYRNNDIYILLWKQTS